MFQERMNSTEAFIYFNGTNCVASRGSSSINETETPVIDEEE